MTIKSLNVFGAILAVMLLALGTSAVQAKTIKVAPPAGYNGRIWSFYAYDEDNCMDAAIRGYAVSRQATHGTVSLKIERKRETRKGKKCYGKTFKALYVYYKAKSRFKGRDTFEINVQHTFDRAERGMVARTERFILDFK